VTHYFKDCVFTDVLVVMYFVHINVAVPVFLDYLVKHALMFAIKWIRLLHEKFAKSEM
jgi:hypothetical protein